MKYLLLLPALLIVFGPDVVQAGGLVPTDLCTGTDCSACHLAELANRLIKWLIGIVMMLFAVLAVWAGFGLVTSGGNPSALQDAKSRFTNAFIGLLIVLSAWLMVDTLMRGLVGGSGEVAGYGPWSEVKCTPQTGSNFTSGNLDIESRADEVDTVGMTAFGPTPQGNASAAGGGLSNAAALARIQAAGIELKENGNVSLEGVRPHVLDALERLDADCNCNILLTSVTDNPGGVHKAGTFSHGTGFKADIRSNDNPDLLQYVRSLQPAGQWQDGTKLYFDSATCGTYAIEATHIDVVYKTGC